MEIYSSEMTVYPGQTNRYVETILQKKILDWSLVEVTVDFHFDSKIDASLINAKTKQKVNAIRGTHYHTSAWEMARKCENPMLEFVFGNMNPSDLIFAVWNPSIEEYTLFVEGVAKRGEVKISVYIETKLIVKHPKVKFSTKSYPEVEVLIFNNDAIAIPQPDPGLDIEIDYKDKATYGFFQIIEKGIFKLSSKETSVTIHTDFEVDFAPDDGLRYKKHDSILYRETCSENCILLFTDAPTILLTSYFDPEIKKGHKCAFISGKDDIVRTDSIDRDLSFGLYLMMKIGQEAEKDSFWVPVRKFTWKLKLTYVCAAKDAVCPSNKKTGWENSGSHFTPFSIDDKWTANPEPPMWLGMNSNVQAVEVKVLDQSLGMCYCGDPDEIGEISSNCLIQSTDDLSY